MKSNELILIFIRNLALADHLGDVGDDVDSLLKMLDVKVGLWGSLDELGEILGDVGVRYMYELGNYNDIRVDDPPILPLGQYRKDE